MNMPSARAPIPTETGYPNWQARALSHDTQTEEKTVVFAPLAIANHIAPEQGEWQARISCPYCDDYTYFDQGEDGEEDVKYVQDDKGFESLQAFQAHLEWYHTAIAVPALGVPKLPTASTSNCRVM